MGGRARRSSLLTVDRIHPGLPVVHHKSIFLALLRSDGDGVREERNEIQESCPTLLNTGDALQRDDRGARLDVDRMRLKDKTLAGQMDSTADRFDALLQVGGAILDYSLAGKKLGLHDFVCPTILPFSGGRKRERSDRCARRL